MTEAAKQLLLMQASASIDAVISHMEYLSNDNIRKDVIKNCENVIKMLKEK